MMENSSSWEWFMACVFPDLTIEEEISEFELGDRASIYLFHSPYDTPQYGDGLMFGKGQVHYD